MKVWEFKYSFVSQPSISFFTTKPPSLGGASGKPTETIPTQAYASPHRVRDIRIYIIVLFMPFLVVCGTSHTSSQLENYGHEKLENPGLGNGPKFV
jgi:hypothetical protein